MISFENVTKIYNKTIRAVEDISFNVKGGEIVGFIGPNGSGKTTTMKLLTGIIKAQLSSDGSVMIYSQDTSSKTGKYDIRMLELKKHYHSRPDRP